MTEIEKAQLASDLLNGLSPLMTGCFLLGLIVGVFFFSRLAQTIDRLGYRLRNPRRIKRACDFGNHGDFEYLYLFKGKYYSLGEFQILKNELLNNCGVKK